MKKIVRVAGGQGFWGDDLDAPRRQVEGGQVDYLMLDYLAEVTMSILQKQKERDPSLGYARDFVGAMESVLPAVLERGVKVVANAGGVNPAACALAVKAAAEKAKAPLMVLDDYLKSHQWLVGDKFSVADLNASSVVNFANLAGVDISYAPNVKPWSVDLRILIR